MPFRASRFSGPLDVLGRLPVWSVLAGGLILLLAIALLVQRLFWPSATALDGDFHPRELGGAARGFAVTDDGGVPFFSAAADLGPPTSRRFWYDGAVHQTFERGALAWDPASDDLRVIPGVGAGPDENAVPEAFEPEPAIVPARDVVGTLGARPVIVLDPGHGGSESGAVGTDARGRPLLEKDLTLAVGLRTAALLEHAGYRVVMTRETDADVAARAPGESFDLGRELQARIDLAEASNADVFVSIHFNALGDPRASGVETYYCAERPHAAENRRLAEAVQTNLVDALRGAGQPAPDRGVMEDSVLSDPGTHQHLYLLGPTYEWQRRVPGLASPITETRIIRPSTMPAVLGEALFLTNPRDRALLDQPWFQNTIARGYAVAITAYLAG